MRIRRLKNKTVVAYDLKIDEIVNLLKVQIKMCFGFKSNIESDYYQKIWILNRTVSNNTQKLEISLELDGSNSYLTTYDDVLAKLSTALNGGSTICEIIFNYKYFDKKLPLIDIIGKVKKDLISGCVYIDYDDGMLSIVNKDSKGLPNKLYFWEETGSLFLFGEDGPKLLYQSDFDSITDILT